MGVYREQPTELFINFTADGVPADPTTVTLDLISPSGTLTSHTGGALENNEVGRWSKIVTLDEVGRWEFRWTATGTVVAMQTGSIEVYQHAFGTGGEVRPLWKPSIEEVAAVIRARTKDDAGDEIGTFTETTRPTQVQVEFYINMVAGTLIACTGDWLPEALRPLSRQTIAVGAAMAIELAYWPEQMDAEDSAYNKLKQLWDMLQPKLCELSGPSRPDDLPGADGGGMLPLYYFGDLPGATPVIESLSHEEQAMYYTSNEFIIGYRTY